MTKRKIVIKGQFHCDKCRSKAMKIAAEADGVASVAIEGKDRDQVVVVGEGVDSVCLTRKLRKKLCYASIVSISEEKPKEPEKPKPPVECWTSTYCTTQYPYSFSCAMPTRVVYESDPGCSIM